MVNIITILLFFAFIYNTAANYDHFFLENNGLNNSETEFLLTSNGIRVAVSESELKYDIFKLNKNNSQFNVQGTAFSMKLINADKMNFKGLEPLAGEYNFFKGNSPSKWATGLKAYRKLIAENVYPGIDLLLYTENGLPRYDFILRPEARPSDIKFRIEGAQAIVTPDNEIEIPTPYGTINHGSVYAYQNIDNEIKKVECRFSALGDQISFQTAEYDKSKPLIIDPLIFSTYCGGSLDDEITAVEVDEEGNIIVAGWTESYDFATTSGAYDTTYNATKDIFVRKYKVSGSERVLVFSSIIGGDYDDVPNSLGIDKFGDIYVAGVTNSEDYPVYMAYQSVPKGKKDGFVTKLKKKGSALDYSTYCGGSEDDVIYDIALGDKNEAYIVGGTFSVDFPIVSADQNTQKGSEDAFFAKISSISTEIEFSTYLGTTANERAKAIAVNENSQTIWVAGETDSGQFPVKPQWFFAKDKPFDRHHNGLQDVFLSLYTTGGSRENTGYFGGEKNEYLTDAIVASNGDLYITGYTESEVSSSELTSESTLFPVTLNAYQIQHAGGLDGFFAKVKRDGTVLIGSTYIGGSGDDKLFALDYHPVTSSIITTGTTTSSDFPIKNNFGESKKSGISDVIIIDISELANSINYSTYIGGKGEDTGYDIASDRKYAYVVAGSTDSKNFDHVQGSFQEDHNGGLDGIIFKNSYSQLSMNIPYPGNSYCRGRVLFFDWNAQGFSQGTVFSLEGSPDDGESWFIIDEEIEDYNYSWMIPDEQPLSDEYRFRVVHESGQYSEINGNIAIDGAPEIDSITINNNSAVFCPGDELMLMVFARGKNLEYQWKKNGNLIENVNSDTLKIESLSESDAGNYEAIIKGACPPDIISDTYQINVLPPVKITRSPADTTVSAGNPIEFHVSARGVNLSYQWQKNGNNIIGATDSTFAIESVADQNDGSYRCIVSGDCNSDTSLAAVLIVEPVTGIQNSNGPLDNSSLKMNVNEAGGNTIDLDIYSGSAGKIKISLYSITGRQISVLYNDEIQSGLNKLMLNTDRLASGVWLLVGTIGDKTTAARLNYIR